MKSRSERAGDRWRPGDPDAAYTELDHPADLMLEIRGEDLPTLFERSLFALYDRLVDLEEFKAVREETIEVEGAGAAEALRSLLAEALYRFSADGFVASRAQVGVEAPTTDTVKIDARLYGETVDPRRHTLLTEIKAVSFHRLAVEALPAGGWRATVLFDV